MTMPTPCVDDAQCKHAEMPTRRHSTRLVPASSVERDESLSEASSVPDLDFRCQDTDTRRQSAPLPVVLVGHAKDTGRVAVVDMASVPKAAGFHDVVNVDERGARRESRVDFRANCFATRASSGPVPDNE